MTLAAPTFPLPAAAALQHLRDALGGNYGGPTDAGALERALGVDALTLEGAAHPRPWATAARLIKENTDYEVGGDLVAQINRKIGGLKETQRQMDVLAGISHLIPGADEGTAWPPVSGAVETRGIF